MEDPLAHGACFFLQALLDLIVKWKTSRGVGYLGNRNHPFQQKPPLKGVCGPTGT